MYPLGVKGKMKNPKPNSRAARKKSQRKKLGLAESPALREIRTLITHEYFQSMKAIDELADAIENSMATPFWATPNFLKKTREQVRPEISQSELARVSGISRLIIANYENGVTAISVDNAITIYRTLFELGSVDAAKACSDLWYLIGLVEIKKEGLLRNRFALVEQALEKHTRDGISTAWIA